MKKGITLVSLVITIVIILILSGVGIYTSITLIEQAKYTAFINEMKQVDEVVLLRISDKITKAVENNENIGDIYDNYLTLDEARNLPTGLIYEIMYQREIKDEIDVSSKLPLDRDYDINDLVVDENNKIYMIDDIEGKEQTYIYDEKSASSYKIEPTIIWGVEMHGYEYGNLLVTQSGLLEKVKKANEADFSNIILETVKNSANDIAIRVTATEPNKGITKIELIGTEQYKEYEKTKEQIIEEFPITKNGKYQVKIYSTDDVYTVKTIEVTQFKEISYQLAIDEEDYNITMQTAYNYESATLTEEQQIILDEIQNENIKNIYPILGENNNVIVSKNADEIAINYKKYSKNNSIGTNKYTVGSRKLIKNDWLDDNYGTRCWVATGYSIDSSTGVYTLTGSYTYADKGGYTFVPRAYASSGAIEGLTGSTLYYVIGSISKDIYQYTTKMTTTYSKGAYISDVIGIGYPTNNRHTDGYWYVQIGDVEKYYLYNYDKENNLNYIYDIDTKSLIIPDISLNKEGNLISMNLDINSSDYNVYYSIDNQTWNTININNIGLDKEIQLSQITDKISIKIQLNAGVLNNIEIYI